MKLTKNTKILIIGLGVIGGGYAKALTDAGYQVSAITKNQEDVDYALAHQMVQHCTTDIDENLIKESQLIIFALYPSVFIQWIKSHQHLFAPGTLITDVTGVKSHVVDTIQSFLRRDVEFIASHPMAGREQNGIEYSDPNVFKDANYIVTPTKENSKHAISISKQLGQILGFARISELSLKEHDQMVAFLSQLTHCIAVCLMNCNNAPHLEKFTGDSFRDLTRIAKINDKMWSELFVMNKAALLESMEDFSKEFEKFKQMIEEEDISGIKEKMQASTARRALFDRPSD